MAVDFGADISTFVNSKSPPDLDPLFRVITGRRVVQEAVARRLITPRGGLLDDPNYGYDVRQWLNSKFSQADLFVMRSRIQAECVKDARVDTTSVTVTPRPDGSLRIVVTLGTADGPFDLVLQVSDLTVELLSAA